MQNKIPVTTIGYEEVIKEHKKLKMNDRPAVIEQIAEAREHGDLKENAEYHAAREKQSFIEGRIAELENIIANAEVIDISKISSHNIVFGATVQIIDDNTEEEKTYQIVGDCEAKLENGKISINSPLARALLGKEEGDIAEFQSPSGKKTYEILAVKYS